MTAAQAMRIRFAEILMGDLPGRRRVSAALLFFVAGGVDILVGTRDLSGPEYFGHGIGRAVPWRGGMVRHGAGPRRGTGRRGLPGDVIARGTAYGEREATDDEKTENGRRHLTILSF